MFQEEEEEAEEERVFLRDELKAHRWGTPASFIFITIFNYRAIFHDLMRFQESEKEKKGGENKKVSWKKDREKERGKNGGDSKESWLSVK